MNFDNEDQKRIFLQLVDQAQWPGNVIEQIVILKQEIRAATVTPRGDHGNSTVQS